MVKFTETTYFQFSLCWPLTLRKLRTSFFRTFTILGWADMTKNYANQRDVGVSEALIFDPDVKHVDSLVGSVGSL